MPIRWYLTPVIQISSAPFVEYAAALGEPLLDDPTARWSGRENVRRNHHIARVVASQAMHDRIVSESLGTALTDLFADDTAENAALDAPHSFGTAAKTFAEDNGYSTSWVVTATTLREILRHMLRVCHVSQLAVRENSAAMKAVLGFALTATVSSLTAQQRTAVRNWMTSHGVDSSWVTNQTLIRNVIHYIIENLAFKTMKAGAKEI